MPDPSQTDESPFETWVTDPQALDRFNDDSKCACGREDQTLLGRFYKHWVCDSRECDRRYATQDGDEYPGLVDGPGQVVDPGEILATRRDGLVPASTNWRAFSLLSEDEWDVQEFIEPFHPMFDDEQVAWMWAAAGYYIGYLTYRAGILRTCVIAEGFRRQGHGREFIETWYNEWYREHHEDTVVDVIAYDRTEPFLERIDVPFNVNPEK